MTGASPALPVFGLSGIVTWDVYVRQFVALIVDHLFCFRLPSFNSRGLLPVDSNPLAIMVNFRYPQSEYVMNCYKGTVGLTDVITFKAESLKAAKAFGRKMKAEKGYDRVTINFVTRSVTETIRSPSRSPSMA